MRCIRSIVHYALASASSFLFSLSLFFTQVSSAVGSGQRERFHGKLKRTPPLFEAVYKFVWMQEHSSGQPLPGVKSETF